AYILNKIIKIKSKSYFVVEMPAYKTPQFRNVFYTVLEKTKAFVFNAGKIILAVSIVLWFLASHGGKELNNVEEIVSNRVANKSLAESELNSATASSRLENSSIGMLGKAIEPVTTPF